MFCIVSSVISFCGAIYPYIGQSCVIFWLLNRYNNGSNVIVNIVSWATISILRYHLLITAKIENKHNELNLPRIRNISLIANWVIIVGLLTLSAIFQMKLLIMPVTMVLFNASIFAVYYKMDLNLKEQQQSKEGKSHYDLEKRKNSGKPISLLFPWFNINIRSSRNAKKVTKVTHLKINNFLNVPKPFQLAFKIL